MDALTVFDHVKYYLVGAVVVGITLDRFVPDDIVEAPRWIVLGTLLWPFTAVVALAYLEYRDQLALVVVGCLALAGCSRLRTVTVPAQKSAVQPVVPDTVEVQELPPAEPGGTPTRPEQVTVIRDTTWRTVELTSLTIDPEENTVTTRTQRADSTVQKTWTDVPFGERLRLEAGSTGLTGTVFGTPQQREVQAVASSIDTPWHERLWTQVRLVIAFLGGLIFGYVVTKLIPGL